MLIALLVITSLLRVMKFIIITCSSIGPSVDGVILL
jgi:hypothetical protein